MTQLLWHHQQIQVWGEFNTPCVCDVNSCLSATKIGPNDLQTEPHKSYHMGFHTMTAQPSQTLAQEIWCPLTCRGRWMTSHFVFDFMANAQTRRSSCYWPVVPPLTQMSFRPRQTKIVDLSKCSSVWSKLEAQGTNKQAKPNQTYWHKTSCVSAQNHALDIITSCFHGNLGLLLCSAPTEIAHCLQLFSTWSVFSLKLLTFY